MSAAPKPAAKTAKPRSAATGKANSAKGKGSKGAPKRLEPVPGGRAMLFVIEYIKDFNGKQAAIRAGYAPGSAEVTASKLLRTPKVKAALQPIHDQRAAQAKELTSRMELSVERTKLEIARLSYFDPRKLFDADGKPIPIHLLDDDAAAVISGLKVVTKGNSEVGFAEVLEYKLADKNSALDKAAKIGGAYLIDNKQKADALGELLAGLSRSTLPIAKDDAQ